MHKGGYRKLASWGIHTLHVSLSYRIAMLELEKKGLGEPGNPQLRGADSGHVGGQARVCCPGYQGHGVKSELVWGKGHKHYLE